VTGTVQRFQIHIDLDGIGADSSLDSVAADINANTPLTATVTTDGRLTLSAPAGTSFSFADDTSGFLAATCVNAFFTGNDSSDINVNAAIVDDPRLVAASQSGLPGDGSNATIWAQIQNNAMSGLGGTSLNAYYTATVGDVAVNSSSAQATLDAAGVIFDTLNVQRESISGVNLDEEAVNMIKFQRSYEGAARYMNVVDSMLQTLLSLIR
jgi:flagellar hook-associated protein 1 FlgK